MDTKQTAISRLVWETRYRYGAEASPADSWQRVAQAAAAVETSGQHHWQQQFLEILQDFRFLPGGRILAGAGTERNVTLFNCFVMGPIRDDLDGIFDALKEGALTMQAGGGVGYDFSTLRPAGSVAQRTGSIASGPVSFMRIWNSMCDTLLSTGTRRGAMIATLRCDHPDIEDFITAKHNNRSLDHFNLSVQVSDEFMQAVSRNQEWALVFPLRDQETATGEVVLRQWPGHDEPVPCRVLARRPARELWRRLMRSAYDTAEPGVLFTDCINHWNNLGYREHITTTNPCGEIPLPPYGACNLGSLNLTRFVSAPFTPGATLDLAAIAAAAGVATRLLDNVIDVSRFPLAAQAAQARGCRRVGLGITGLADALIMLGLPYNSGAGRALAGEAMAAVCHSAYRTSIQLAREKGPFPYFDRDAYVAAPFIQSLPADLRQGIAEFGIRNSHLTAIAPCGTISLLADNVSSGIEPVFDFRLQRRLLQADGSYREVALTDYAYALRSAQGDGQKADAAVFATSQTLPPDAHLQMQAALQAHVDNAISKTVNVPMDFPFEQFVDLYQRAYSLGLKGCTAYRPNPVSGAVLSILEPEATAVHCCNVEREGD